jgi:hypothetical protein
MGFISNDKANRTKLDKVVAANRRKMEACHMDHGSDFIIVRISAVRTAARRMCLAFGNPLSRRDAQAQSN